MPAYPWQQVYKAAVLERDPAKWNNLSSPLSLLFMNICVLAATSRRKKVKREQTPCMLV